MCTPYINNGKLLIEKMGSIYYMNVKQWPCGLRRDEIRRDIRYHLYSTFLVDTCCAHKQQASPSHCYLWKLELLLVEPNSVSTIDKKDLAAHYCTTLWAITWGDEFGSSSENGFVQLLDIIDKRPPFIIPNFDKTIEHHQLFVSHMTSLTIEKTESKDVHSVTQDA